MTAAALAPEAEAVPPAAPATRHFSGLDGLRGLAAAIVVFRHSVEGVTMPEPLWNSLFRSPAALLLNAQGAVQIFFVLSGFVLALSLSRGRGRFDWVQFYVKRIFRIHPPFVFAVLFAWGASLFYTAIPRGLGLSQWLAMWTDVEAAPRDVLASLAFPGDGAGLLPVGWTLQIEMIFSFLLPVLVLAARPLRGVPLLVVAALLLLLPREAHVLWYTIDFAFGVLVFRERERLRRVLGGLPGWGQGGVVFASLAVLCAPLVLQGPGATVGDFCAVGFTASHVAVMSVGAALLVASVVSMPALQRALSARPCLFLGRISYSLYLLHYPLLLMIASAAVPEGLPLGRLGFIASVMAASIAFSVFAYQLVELPSIRAGNRICRWLAPRLGSRAAESHAASS